MQTQSSSGTRRHGNAGIAMWGVMVAASLASANTFGQACQSCQATASVGSYAASQPSVTHAATTGCPQVTYDRCGQVTTRVVYTQSGRGRRGRVTRQTVVYRAPTYYPQPTCGQVVQVASASPCPTTAARNLQPPTTSSVVASAPCPCNAAAVTNQVPPCATVSGTIYRVLPDGSVVQQSPYSLSGYVIPDSQRTGPGQQMFHSCADEFLACCAAGGTNCMATYQACAVAFGEPIIHTSCPVNEDPNPEDPPENP